MNALEQRLLADQVRRAIESREETPAEIARLSGVNKGALSRFLRGERSLTLSSLEKLAPVLGLRIVTERRKTKK